MLEPIWAGLLLQFWIIEAMLMNLILVNVGITNIVLLEVLFKDVLKLYLFIGYLRILWFKYILILIFLNVIFLFWGSHCLAFFTLFHNLLWYQVLLQLILIWGLKSKAIRPTSWIHSNAFWSRFIRFMPRCSWSLWQFCIVIAMLLFLWSIWIICIQFVNILIVISFLINSIFLSNISEFIVKHLLDVKSIQSQREYWLHLFVLIGQIIVLLLKPKLSYVLN